MMGRPPGRTLLFVAAAVDLAAAAVVVVHSCMVRQMQMGHHLHYSHRVFHVLSTGNGDVLNIESVMAAWRKSSHAISSQNLKILAIVARNSNMELYYQLVLIIYNIFSN